MDGTDAVLMHRIVMETPEGSFTDHIDGNGLNNTRNNLRICTKHQNQMNRRLPTTNKTGYKGVSVYRSKRKKFLWRSEIQMNRKTIYLGLYFCLIKAAKAYDEAAKELFGEFAKLNFPE
jgi:hypothetical protein